MYIFCRNKEKYPTYYYFVQFNLTVIDDIVHTSYGTLTNKKMSFNGSAPSYVGA